MPARLFSVVCLPLMMAALLSAAGCRPIGYAPRLVGRWVGSPETAEQRAARSPAALVGEDGDPAAAGDVTTDNVAPSDAATDAEAPPGPTGRTTLESLDVRVTLDLAVGGAARMWIGADEADALSGTWRVVSYDLDRAVVEIVAERSAAAAEAEEKRRFAVQLMEDDRALLLSEEGADRFFGRLYFRRAGSDPDDAEG